MKGAITDWPFHYIWVTTRISVFFRRIFQSLAKRGLSTAKLWPLDFYMVYWNFQGIEKLLLRKLLLGEQVTWRVRSIYQGLFNQVFSCVYPKYTFKYTGKPRGQSYPKKIMTGTKVPIVGVFQWVKTRDPSFFQIQSNLYSLNHWGSVALII